MIERIIAFVLFYVYTILPFSAFRQPPHVGLNAYGNFILPWCVKHVEFGAKNDSDMEIPKQLDLLVRSFKEEDENV